MSAQPLVSAIIATNRSGEFLEEALTSVARQSYPNWEVVVVDDGSPVPGELDRIVEPYDRMRIVHQRASGVSVARNVGVAASSGEYCAFLDDDDIWLPERLALQVAAMERDDRPVLAYGRISSIDEHGQVLARAGQHGARDIHGIFDGSGTPQFQTVMVRRDSLLRVGGFHSALRYAEDLDLILRLAREGTFAFVDAEVAQYRQHSANVTTAHRPLAASIDAVLRLQEVRAQAVDDGTYRDLQIRRRSNGRYAFWRAARAARTQGRLAGAGEFFWAFKFAPAAPFDAIGRRIRGLVDRRGSGGSKS